MMSMYQLFSQKKNKGFAILFAVLTASLLLSIGLSIFSLTIKELALSSSGRESTFAFYAADSGGECAHYWDTVGALQAGDPSPFSAESGELSPISCGTNPIVLSQSSTPPDPESGATTVTTAFGMDVDDANHYCAAVTVTEVVNSDESIASTEIDSRGYNICSGSTPTYTDPNLVERGLELNY